MLGRGYDEKFEYQCCSLVCNEAQIMASEVGHQKRYKWYALDQPICSYRVLGSELRLYAGVACNCWLCDDGKTVSFTTHDQ